MKGNVFSFRWVSLILIIALVLSLALSACGKTENNGDENANTENDENIIENTGRTIKEESLQYPGKNDDWEYDVYENYVVVRKYIGKSTEIVIPETIDNLPVVKLEGKVFDAEQLYGEEFSSTPIQVTIPASIIEISDSLVDVNKRVVIDDVTFTSEEKINFTGSFIFHYCTFDSDTAMDIINHIAGDTIPLGFFDSCDNIKEITIPDNINYIKAHAFEFCKSLTKVDLGNTGKVHCKCFDVCSNLKELYVRNKECAFIDDNGDTSNKILGLYGLYGGSSKQLKDSVHAAVEGLTVFGYKGSTAAALASEIGCSFSPLD